MTQTQSATAKPSIICSKCERNMVQTGISEKVRRIEYDSYLYDGENMVIDCTNGSDDEILETICTECGEKLTPINLEEYEELN